MKTPTVIPYSSMPSLSALLVKAMISRKPGLKEPLSLAPIERTISGIRINRKGLKEYNAFCGFQDHETIPLPYFYTMAQRIQLALLTDPSFPIRVPGLVHIDNTFRQFGPVSIDDVFDCHCRVSGNNETAAGRIIEMESLYCINGTKTVQCRSRFLHRRRGRTSPKNNTPPLQPLQGHTMQLSIPSNAGRRYAGISGDYNPIHLHALTARPFGFRRPIAHGIYMTALINAVLEKSMPFDITSLQVEYKRPVYLPSQVTLVYRPSEADKSCQFEARSGNGEQVHIKGFISSGRGEA